MAGRAVFTVTHPEAPAIAADPGIGAVAARIADDARSRTPVETGRLAAGWQVVQAGRPGERDVINAVPYARFVEYGTKNMPAEPMLGPAAARYRGPL
jgi:HK97 gp10 family phage protein